MSELTDEDLNEIEKRVAIAAEELEQRLRITDETILNLPAVKDLRATELGELLVNHLPAWLQLEVAVSHSVEIVMADRALKEARAIVDACTTERQLTRALPCLRLAQIRNERIQYPITVELGRRDPAEEVVYPVKDVVEPVIDEILELLDIARRARDQAIEMRREVATRLLELRTAQDG